METSVNRSLQKFHLPVALTKRLADAVPARKRSRFVEKAIEAALRAEAKAKVLDLLETMPRHSTGGQQSLDVIQQLRDERSGQLSSRYHHLAQ